MSSESEHPLPPRMGYRLWAPSYERENPVTALDQAAVARLTPSLVGRHLLDAGCGTGRRTPLRGPAGPALAIGIDFVREMLLATKRPPEAAMFASADLRNIPFGDGTFDAVWCRLAIGHIEAIGDVYGELSRVLRPHSFLIVTDFHPESTRAGYVRSFRDTTGKRRVIEHYPHELDDHERAAAASGLQTDITLSLAVGPDVKTYYEESGLLELYEEQLGLPVLLAIRFRR